MTWIRNSPRHRTPAIDAVATISLARAGEPRSRVVASSIWSHSQVVAFIAAMPKKPAMWENAPSTAPVAWLVRIWDAWQKGLSACAPSQLIVG